MQSVTRDLFVVKNNGDAIIADGVSYASFRRKLAGPSSLNLILPTSAQVRLSIPYDLS